MVQIAAEQTPILFKNGVSTPHDALLHLVHLIKKRGDFPNCNSFCHFSLPCAWWFKFEWSPCPFSRSSCAKRAYTLFASSIEDTVSICSCHSIGITQIKIGMLWARAGVPTQY